MLSIDNLKSTISKKGGMARNNMFLVKLPSFANIESRELNIICKSTNMPGKQIATIERQIGIRTEKVAYSALFDDVSLTFFVLNDFGIKKYFDEWQNMIINKENNMIGYKKDYARDIEIAHINPGAHLRSTGGNVIGNQKMGRENFTYVVRLHDAFPTTVNAIELTNDPDGLIEYNVQLSYSKWIDIPI